MRKTLFALLLAATCYNTGAQPLIKPTAQPMPAKEHRRLLHDAEYQQAGQIYKAKTTASGMVFDTTRWAHLVDSTWGAGLSTAQKLTLFNTFWNRVDSQYACFVNLPMYNWDSIVNAMRTEISGGVSKGRFAGIASSLIRYLNDGHTGFRDHTVNYGSGIYPGKPLFRGESGLFGACLTMLADSQAMVYDVRPGHVLGLQPGDIILGYNGIPWTQLVATMLRHQLPAATYVGSTDAATYHGYIQAAGENWYLFDTINIKKCDGSVVNKPTSLMIGTSYTDLFCTEQLPVAGVRKMSYTDYYVYDRVTTSGVITGTNIGYVALYDCGDMSGDSLYTAVKRLVEDSLVSGLIIDIRTNFGGSIMAFNKTFDYLNDGNLDWLGCANRVSPTDRYMMNPYYWPTTTYFSPDTDPHVFDKKIAVLQGPGAISAGDIFQVMYTHHPQLKTFGKPTAAAFGAYYSISLPSSGYSASYQDGNFYEAADLTSFLTHVDYPIDSSVWFNRASVCAGEDNILTTAVQWIGPSLSAPGSGAGAAPAVRVYPNPVQDHINLSVDVASPATAAVQLLNIAGASCYSTTYQLSAGNNKLQITGLDLPSGCYQLVISGDGIGRQVRKVMVVR